MRGTLPRAPGLGGISSVALCVLILSACGSSTEPSETELFLRFNANGSLVEFTNAASLFAAFTSTSGQSNLVITGYDAVSGTNLQIYDNGPVGTGTYSGYGVVGNVLVGTLMAYEDPSGTEYVTNPGSADVTITVSEITDTRVRGTFSGTLEASGEPDLVVTAGSFVVQRAN